MSLKLADYSATGRWTPNSECFVAHRERGGATLGVPQFDFDY